MRIPSYDDLTPSIPDMSVRDTFAQVRRILPPDATAPAGPVEPLGSDAPARLFACLRSSSPELRRASEASRAAAPGGGAPGALNKEVPGAVNLMAIARDFSPRIERHGPACVVLDVSGL